MELPIISTQWQWALSAVAYLQPWGWWLYALFNISIGFYAANRIMAETQPGGGLYTPLPFEERQRLITKTAEDSTSYFLGRRIGFIYNDKTKKTVVATCVGQPPRVEGVQWFPRELGGVFKNLDPKKIPYSEYLLTKFQVEEVQIASLPKYYVHKAKFCQACKNTLFVIKADLSQEEEVALSELKNYLNQLWLQDAREKWEEY